MLKVGETSRHLLGSEWLILDGVPLFSNSLDFWNKGVDVLLERPAVLDVLFSDLLSFCLGLIYAPSVEKGRLPLQGNCCSPCLCFYVYFCHRVYNYRNHLPIQCQCMGCAKEWSSYPVAVSVIIPSVWPMGAWRHGGGYYTR